MQEDKVKIGIVTHYYNSTNFGGNLQAYALCKFLNETFSFAEAEQIAYDIRKNPPKPRGVTNITVSKVLKKIRNILQNKLYAKTRAKENRAIQTRKKAVLAFNRQAIPHSETVYDADTVAQCAARYDVFITGSDQVWHPSAVCPAYLLQFVSGAQKPKISYAASVAKTELSEEEKAVLKNALADYSAVSVREEDAVGLLSDLSPVEPVWTLDPTLLLAKAQWEAVAAEKRTDGAYIFCYFLGDDKRQRTLAEAFAKEKGLKIVTLPFLQGKYRKCDAGFGDETLFDVSVPDFLSLIQHADYVLTDSFHAAVFSLLFEKEYFVFERSGAKGAGSRIYSLLSLFDMTPRFCDTSEKTQLSYLIKQPPLCYSGRFEKFDDRKNLSVHFLETALSMARMQNKD